MFIEGYKLCPECSTSLLMFSDKFLYKLIKYQSLCLTGTISYYMKVQVYTGAVSSGFEFEMTSRNRQCPCRFMLYTICVWHVSVKVMVFHKTLQCKVCFICRYKDYVVWRQDCILAVLNLGILHNMNQICVCVCINIYIFKPPSCTTKFTSLQVISSFQLSHHQEPYKRKHIPAYGIEISFPYNMCHKNMLKCITLA